MERKINILFVDDEPNVINGLRRILLAIKTEWETYFVLNGKDAIKLIEEKEIDIIFADFKMPEMDGTSLLELVKKMKPGIVRIIVSDSSEQNIIISAAKTAHQFLSKPYNPDVLKSIVEKVIYLKKFIYNRSFINIIGGIESLPNIPELYSELEKEINALPISGKRISEIVSKDISMTAKILQFANSDLFGQSKQSSNILQALNYIGLDTFKSLVLVVKIFSVDLKESSFNINEFGKHSLQVAKLSHGYVLERTSNQETAEKAFMAGLLHDIGKLALLKIPGYYNKVLEISKKENLSFIEAEYKFFNTSHAEVGAYLLGLWGFPKSFIEVIAYHHTTKSDENFVNDDPDSTANYIANYFTQSGNNNFISVPKFKTDDKLIEYKSIVEKVKESLEQKSIFR